MQIMLRDTCSKNKIISRLDIESHRQTLVHSKEDINKKALTSTAYNAAKKDVRESEFERLK